MSNKKTITTKLQAAYDTLGTVAQKDNWRILQILNVADARPVDLAGMLPITRNNLNIHLKDLVKKDLIVRRSVSNNEVWYSINHYNYAMVMTGITIMSMDYKEITLIQ